MTIYIKTTIKTKIIWKLIMIPVIIQIKVE